MKYLLLMKLENLGLVIPVVLSEESHLLLTFSKADNFSLLFQIPWPFSLRVPPHL